MAAHENPQPFAVQQAILGLLRLERPAEDLPEEAIDATLRRYECGGYLHVLWSRAGRLPELPPGWAAGLAAAHHRTAVDSLAALAEFRAAGRILRDGTIPFILLKGAAYLLDLYDDPGARALTDVDLVVRPTDAGRAGRLLARAGYAGRVGPQYPEDRRFEMVLPGDGRCAFEIHWRLGAPFRFTVDQESLWSGARPATLEGVPCQVLGREHTLLYHVAHLADHYFGPSLKWLIDLREMLRRFAPDETRLAAAAGAWRIRTALYLALRHLALIFPADARPPLMERVRPGRVRRLLLESYLSSGPLEMMEVDRATFARYPLRLLLADRSRDALGLGLTVLSRPLARLRRPVPPWEWSD